MIIRHQSRGFSRLRGYIFLSAVAVSVLMIPSPVFGYAGDTHYYLRFAAALTTCFDWREAHLIASADCLVDKNRTTTAEKQPFKKYNKIHWHAFGKNQERFNELRERVIDEPDPHLQMIKLGQFFHFISDWESHHGYGVTWRRPASLSPWIRIWSRGSARPVNDAMPRIPPPKQGRNV